MLHLYIGGNKVGCMRFILLFIASLALAQSIDDLSERHETGVIQVAEK